jgi:hypothetical protein
MQSAQTPNLKIELSEQSIKRTIDCQVEEFRKDSERLSSLELLDTYATITRSRLVGMWLLLSTYPHLTCYVDQKEQEFKELFELADTRIKSSDLGRSPASSLSEVGQEGNQ